MRGDVTIILCIFGRQVNLFLCTHLCSDDTFIFLVRHHVDGLVFGVGGTLVPAVTGTVVFNITGRLVFDVTGRLAFKITCCMIVQLAG